MSTHNLCFNGEISKILSLITKYVPSLSSISLILSLFLVHFSLSLFRLFLFFISLCM